LAQLHPFFILSQKAIFVSLGSNFFTEPPTELNSTINIPDHRNEFQLQIHALLTSMVVFPPEKTWERVYAKQKFNWVYSSVAGK
jgi:hypothetical protein